MITETYRYRQSPTRRGTTTAVERGAAPRIASPAGGDGDVARMRHRRNRRQTSSVLLMATLFGLWLGVAAPSTSPVAPPARPSAAVSAPAAVRLPTP